MCLPKFNIYQDTVAPNCFKSHTDSWYPDIFLKKTFCLTSGLKFTLSNVTSFPPENLSELKKSLVTVLEIVSRFRSNMEQSIQEWTNLKFQGIWSV